MSLLLVAVFRWLISKGFVILIAGTLIVGGFAFYTFVQEGIDEENERSALLEDLRGKAELLKLEASEYEERLHEVAEQAKEARRDLERAQKGIAYLKGALAKVEYIFMSPEERERYNKRLGEEEKRERVSVLLIESLELESLNLDSLKDLAFANTKNLNREIGEIEAMEPSLATHILDSWRAMKTYFFVTLAIILFGPFVLKLFAFYVGAPFLSWAKPISFADKELELPTLGRSSVSASIELGQGDVAWVKESYLQASDENLEKKTCFVLDWKIPFTCMAAGLVELIRFKVPNDASSASITVSTQDRSDVELVDVTLSEGTALIIRPSHIAGVVSRKLDGVLIKRHWRLFNIQSWVTLQFRYFEIKGPCVVFISGIRGVRSERILADNAKGRRTNQSATIGFVPSLHYSVVRAETFWSYLRGLNPLFDDVFRGNGLFLCQEISNTLEGASAKKFWSQVWNSILKVLGI
ncbi:hypothetical protein MLD52_04275 [Puniceicoccaceae bacterium K14]|nr:hypothetical protein [Puniceicoccaceae bacterium K14]